MIYELQDTIILDRLGNPNFIFSYKIRTDSTVLVDHPCSVLCPNLRTAVSYIRAFRKEIPFCPVCKTHPVTENFSIQDGLTRRWQCDKCQT